MEHTERVRSIKVWTCIVLIAFAGAAAILIVGCGSADRPLGPPGCNEGLDGASAYCETTGGPVSSCAECPR